MLPAMPDSIVSRSTFEAPSWGKKWGCGILERPIVRPKRRGGYTEHPIRWPKNLKVHGTQRLRNASCFRPVAGESYKNEDPSICSRTFRKTQSNYGCWCSHLHFREEKEKGKRPVAQDEGSQNSQEDPLAWLEDFGIRYSQFLLETRILSRPYVRRSHHLFSYRVVRFHCEYELTTGNQWPFTDHLDFPFVFPSVLFNGAELL